MRSECVSNLKPVVVGKQQMLAAAQAVRAQRATCGDVGGRPGSRDPQDPRVARVGIAQGLGIQGLIGLDLKRHTTRAQIEHGRKGNTWIQVKFKGERPDDWGKTAP